MMKEDPDRMRIYCAAAYMCAKAHDVKLSNLTFEDVCNFMDSLDEDGAEVLGEFADKLEYRDGAVWFGGKQVMWMPTTH
jgi:hypothetical protein